MPKPCVFLALTTFIKTKGGKDFFSMGILKKMMFSSPNSYLMNDIF